MDFQLSEEQALIRDSAREIAEDLSALPASEALRNLAEADFLGLFYSEENGGAGGDFLSYIVALEELAKVSASVALAYAVHATQACYAIASFADRPLKEKYLSSLFSGERIAAYAYGGGWPERDVLDNGAAAGKIQNGYVINGEKTFVYNGSSADVYVVFAQTGEGLSAFVVERGAEGLAVSDNYEKMGMDQISLNTLTLKDVYVPEENLIGKEGDGAKMARAVFNLNSVSLAAIACGISHTAIEKTVAYGKERKQFNCPVLSFEAMSEMLGRMTITLDAAELLTFKAAVQKEESAERYIPTAYHARAFAIRSGEEICTDAIQMHGGYGYSRDLGVEKLLRDMKGLSVFEQLPKPIVLAAAAADIS